MTPSQQLGVRGARDRLVDLLGLGATAPLQDTEVVTKTPLVPLGQPAEIRVVPGQGDVRYLLRRVSGAFAGGSGTRGKGDETILQITEVLEDVTYEVRARKESPSQSEDDPEATDDPKAREVFLDQTVTLRVGLATALSARIEGPLLDPTAGADTDPRLIDHAAEFRVRVDHSQEGVEYRLVEPLPNDRERVLTATPTIGTGEGINLTARGVHEDTKVRLRVTQRFAESLDQQDQTQLVLGSDDEPLDLPLRVRPDPTVALSVAPSSLVAFGSRAATVVLADSQESCTYRLVAHRLADSDFVFDDDVGEAEVAEFSGDGLDTGAAAPRVIVARPVAGDPDETEGEKAVGEAEDAQRFTLRGPVHDGTGGELSLPLDELADGEDRPLGPLHDDLLILVEAAKTHSKIWLDTAAVVLVTPDPAHPVELAANIADGVVRGGVIVSGGQPGVFYHLTPSDSERRSLPAFVHQVDELDAARNKGIGGRAEPSARLGLRLGVDFVIIASVPGPDAPEGRIELGRRRPPPPAVDLDGLAVEDGLSIRAVRARSGASVDMAHRAQIVDLPEIRVDDDDPPERAGD